MGKRRLLLFTNSFPFGSEEAFLEEEIKEWGSRDDVLITILPLLNYEGTLRTIPENVTVDVNLGGKLKTNEKWVLFSFPMIFINPFFWKEFFAFPNIFFQFKKLRKVIAVSIFSTVISNYLKKNYLSELNDKNTILYSYWFYYGAYGGALLKRRGFSFRLFTRAHGSDIFQNRKDTAFYIPYRRFPVWKYFEKIIPVSRMGEKYLEENQKIPKEKMIVSYLGVNIPKYICEASSGKSLNIVSCSSIISLKRIHLIITSLAFYTKSHADIKISWFHIGDGPLMPKISKIASTQFSPVNVDYNFLGQLSNSEVLDFYNNNKIDCFVTTSESEGLPVTIMEALSFGIPVIATSVGGITEAVNDNVGVVLDKNFSHKDFAIGLNKMFEFKEHNRRKGINRWAKERFDAETNYEKFISILLVGADNREN